MTYAADIYLSSGGSDTNNGSAGAPVKTLSKAFTMAQVDDVIHVTSMININEEPTGTGARATIDITGLSTTLVLVKDGVTYTTWNASNGTLGIIPHTRSMTIVGDSKATCGFDGNNASCIIRHDQSLGSAVITYKNLTFKNGKTTDNSGGGAVYVRQSGWAAVGGPITNFENCDFLNNLAKTDKPGGAVCVLPAAVNFKSCRFAENIASKGAGLYVERGKVSLEDCIFENHDLTVEAPTLTAAAVATSNGAALMANLLSSGDSLKLDVKNTLFKNNKAANGGAFSTGESNAITAGKTNVTFTACAFVGNTAATGTGGAAFINNTFLGPTADISFINTTFNDNLSGTNTAGAILGKSLITGSINMINCTVSGNKVTGTSGAGGAGVRFGIATATSTRKIQNCILENNIAVDANPTSAADYADLGIENSVDPVTLAETPSYVAGTTLIIEKSLIGSCKNTDFETQFPMSKVNYAFELNGSIANSYKAKLGVFNEEKNYFPLLAASEAIGYGKVSFLTGLTPAVTTDQIGRNRPAVNCSAGAYEYEAVSGIASNKDSHFIAYAVNSSVVVSGEGMTGQNLSIYSIDGRIAKSMIMTSDKVNVPLNKGFYIVKAGVNSVKVLVQ